MAIYTNTPSDNTTHRLIDKSKQVCHDAAGLPPAPTEGLGEAICFHLRTYSGVVDNGGVVAGKYTLKYFSLEKG